MPAVPATSGVFELDVDPDRVDVEVVWSFLSRQAYWGRWRGRDDLTGQLTSAWRVVGAYHRATGRMVGFARAVSDGVALAYLADLFVLPEARGHGLGKDLVRVMIEEGPGAGFRWLLHTADAHDLYRRFGFTEPDRTCLERPSTLAAADPN